MNSHFIQRAYELDKVEEKLSEGERDSSPSLFDQQEAETFDPEVIARRHSSYVESLEGALISERAFAPPTILEKAGFSEGNNDYPVSRDHITANLYERDTDDLPISDNGSGS